MLDHILDAVKCIALSIGNSIIHMSEISDCTRFAVVKAFNDPNFATENENNPSQEETPCEAENESVEVGQWVVVDCNGDHFNGEFTSIMGDDYKDNEMHRSGNYWKWPNKADEIFYKCQKIVKVISPPVVVGSQGQYSFQN